MEVIANTDQADVNALPHALQSAVLSLLSPRTLSVCACVCRGWWELVAEQAWREAFFALWSPPLAAAAAVTKPHAWQLSYTSRQDAARCWLGRPSTDKLVAHRTAVKACCLLPGRDLLFTGGVDRTVRAWDLQGGVQLACSRRHGGTVRCVAADSTLLASGSSDHAIRVWRASSSSDASSDPSGIGSSRGSSSGGSHPSSRDSSFLPFDLAGDRAVLEGHAGPVSCLQLTPSLIVSGSWDCSVRLWDRATLDCVGMVHTDDWVSSLAVKGGLLAAACGTTVQLFRLEGSSLHRVGSLACPSLGGGGVDVPAAVTAVDCTADGRNVFMGTADGGVWLADVPAGCAAEPSSGSGGGGGALASGHQRPVLLQRQPAEVAGLSWDHPWLAVADRAGNVLLLDAGTCTAAGAAAVEGSKGAAAAASGRRAKKQLALTSRVLFSASMGGAGAAAQCVCLDGTWAAAGLDCGTALSFDGSKGQQQLAAAAAARQQKAERRQRNLERQQQQQQRGSKGGGGAGSTKRSQPLPIPPRPAQTRQGDQLQQEQQRQYNASPSQQQQQQQTRDQPDDQQHPLSSSRGRSLLGRSPSARVPPPLPRDALAAASSCRQQAWHVLRPARSAGGGEGSSASPAPQL